MSCPPSEPKKVFFELEEGLAIAPCKTWHNGFPTKNSYLSYDKARFRSGCTSVKMINGFRGASNYANAYCEYESKDHDVWTLMYNGYDIRRRKGRTSQGVFFGGPGWIGGLLDFTFWVTPGGYVQSRIYYPDLNDQSITEALAKVADGKMQILESIAEADQTIGMLYDTLMLAYRALKAVRNGDIKGLLKALGPQTSKKSGGRRKGGGGSSADLWLQFQYGWKPLLSDVYAVAKLVEEGLRKSGRIYSAKADVRRFEDVTSFRVKPRDFTIWKHEGEVSVFSQTKFYFKVTDPWIATLESCGVLNPALLAWNLIPYSFVVDWFLSIGTWLQTLSATLGTEYLGGYTTYGSRITEYLEWLDEPKLCGIAPNGTVKIKQFQRTAHPTWPHGTIYVKNPFTSLTRVVTALALIRQLR